MKRCHHCGAAWLSDKRQPGFKETCESCSAYLHACLNCRFYAPQAHNQCISPTSEWVKDRRGANFCDDFEFKDAEVMAKDQAKEARARSALNSLFGETGEAKKPRSVDDLFGG